MGLHRKVNLIEIIPGFLSFLQPFVGSETALETFDP